MDMVTEMTYGPLEYALTIAEHYGRMCVSLGYVYERRELTRRQSPSTLLITQHPIVEDWKSVCTPALWSQTLETECGTRTH